MIVLGTASSDSVLPQIMRKLEHMGIKDSTVGLVIPTGYSFNLDAFSIYLTLATVFIAQATNTPLAFSDLLLILGVALLTSKGAHGIPGSAIVVLAATLSAVPVIPAIGLVLVLSVDWFMGMARALGNLIGNCVATVVIAAWEGDIDRDRAHAVLNGTHEDPTEDHLFDAPRRRDGPRVANAARNRPIPVARQPSLAIGPRRADRSNDDAGARDSAREERRQQKPTAGDAIDDRGDRRVRRLRQPPRPGALQRGPRAGPEGQAHLDRLLDLRDVDVRRAQRRRLHLRREPLSLRADRLAGAAGDGDRHPDRLLPDEPDRPAVDPRGHPVPGDGPHLARGDGRQPRRHGPRRGRHRLVRRADLLRLEGGGDDHPVVHPLGRGAGERQLPRARRARLGQLPVHVVLPAA